MKEKIKQMAQSKRTVVVFVAGFTVLAAALLIITKAASPSYSVQPEDGQISGGATLITDSSASGGKAIQFKGAATGTGCNPKVEPGTGAGPTSATPCRYGLSGGPGGTWNLDWHDEFDGTSLDTTKWYPNYLGGTPNDITKASNSSMQNCEDPAQTTEGGGRLKLTLVQRSCKANNGTTYSYASGYASTHKTKVITGPFYVETQMYMPPVSGGLAGSSACANWAGIWTNGVASGVSWPVFLESDVMECLGGNAAANVHSGPAGNDDSWHKAIGGISSSVSSGWHVFGASLEKSTKSCSGSTPDAAKLTYYYDGNQIGSPYETCYKNTGQFIMLQNDIQANSAKNALPSTVQFDYVRVWTR
jgi:hypothetical protein